MILSSRRHIPVLLFVLSLLTALMPVREAQAVEDVVLCDGKTYDGYSTTPFEIDGAQGSVERDPSKRKIIRNCTFRNSQALAIRILNADNVLIENSTFENIRSMQAGKDLNAIAMPCLDGFCAVNNITIRSNRFRNIGSDGVHVGTFGREITHVWIEGNDFANDAGIGENAIDVKGVDGPVHIVANTIHGMRPCAFDCSGSNGEGIVIHSRDGGATNVFVERNQIYDNVRGIVISRGTVQVPPENIVVRNNWIYDNSGEAIQVRYPHSVYIYNNTLVDNQTNLRIENVDAVSGSSCEVMNNLYAGTGGEASLMNSSRCVAGANFLYTVAQARFANAGVQDFHLLLDSPAIDAGRDLSASVPDDFDRQSRPIGAAFDVGGDEASGGVPATPTASSTVMPTQTPTGLPTSTPKPTETPTKEPTATQIAQSVTVYPTHDSFTNKDRQNQNNGQSVALEVDGSPVKYVWLMFKVTGVTGAVTRARLRMYVADPSSTGGDLYAASNTSWNENDITWANQPAVDGAQLGTVGKAARGSWVEWDLTAAVKGDGTYTFALKTSDADNAKYKSAEAGGKRPELIIDFGG